MAESGDSQDVFADYAVSRAFSLAATILDAGPYGLTKQQIRQRVEHYRSESEQSRTAWERLFSRDKAILRDCGVRLREPEASVPGSADDYRYSIDPADYGIPELELDAAELIVLQQAQRAWAGLRAQSSVQQAAWALRSTSGDPESENAGDAGAEVVGPGPELAPANPARLTVGTDADLAQLEHIAAVGRGRPAVFRYIRRGQHETQWRRVVVLGAGVLGHWYLVAYDLDRQGLRTFRTDRIHGAVSAMPTADQQRADRRDRHVIEEISAGRLYADIDISRILADRGPEDSPERVLRGVLGAHQDPPSPPRLRPMRQSVPKEPTPDKLERSLSLAAYLLSSGGARPSQLQEHFQVTPRQLLKDLLSLQQAGTFGAEQFGEFVDVVPAPPLTVKEFEAGYLPSDPLITLELHGKQSGRLMSRPVSLTKPGALSLLVALEGLLRSPDAQGHQLASAAQSLRSKLSRIVPEDLLRWSHALAIDWDVDDPQGFHERLREAVQQGYAVELRYTDSAGRASQRVVEPAALLYNGPRTYLRAWCRSERAERNFLVSRVESLTARPEDPIQDHARALARQPAVPPSAPVSEAALTAVLQFVPSAAAAADNYMPQRQHISADGTRTVEARFTHEETLIRVVLSAGGDVTLLEPEHLRREILRRAESRLAEAAEAEDVSTRSSCVGPAGVA